MKISRIAQVGAVAAVAALTLAGCAVERDRRHRADRRRRLHALRHRSNGAGATSQQVAVQAWTAGFQTANPDVTINYDPAGSGTGRESFQSGAVAFAGSDRAFTIDEIAGRSVRRLRRRLGHRRDPDVHLADRRSSSTSTASTRSTSTPRRSPASSPARSPPGTTRRSPRPTTGVTLPDTAVTPVHRSDKSGTTGNFTDYLAGRTPRTSGPTAPSRSGRSRAARPPRAPRASSTPSRAATAPSATPTRRRPAASPPSTSRSATSSSATRPRARRSLDASAVRRGPRRDRPRDLDRPHHDRGRRLPGRADQLPDRLRRVRRRRRRRPRQGLLLHARSARRDRTPPPRTRAAPRSPTPCARRQQAAVDVIK